MLPWNIIISYKLYQQVRKEKVNLVSLIICVERGIFIYINNDGGFKIDGFCKKNTGC